MRVGFDLDRTLAIYEDYYKDKYGITYIGQPISKMIDRLKEHLAKGDIVKIYTARITPYEYTPLINDILNSIRKWCFENIGEALPITNIKDFDLMYDDKTLQVIPNTGELVQDKITNIENKINIC